MFRLVIIIYLLCIMVACKQESIDKHTIKSPFPVVGQIELVDSLLLEVIDLDSPIEVIGQGFNWSEGPLWLKNQNKLIFSDVPENIIYSWDEISGVQIYLKPAGYTGPTDIPAEGPNGLALDNQGNLLICQHGDRVLAKMKSETENPFPNFLALASRYNEKRFSSPNDLCVSSRDDIFFTDPPYGLPNQDEDAAKEINFNGVYRITTKGDVLLVDSGLTRPNGIALSRDEKFLYVANSDHSNAIWIKYSLDAYLNATDKKILLDMTSEVASKKGLPDGLKIHSNGYLFATGPGGVLVVHPDGRHLGTINTGEATSNCAFDDKENWLYMTADDYLMRVKLRK